MTVNMLSKRFADYMHTYGEIIINRLIHTMTTLHESGSFWFFQVTSVLRRVTKLGEAQEFAR